MARVSARVAVPLGMVIYATTLLFLWIVAGDPGAAESLCSSARASSVRPTTQAPADDVLTLSEVPRLARAPAHPGRFCWRNAQPRDLTGEPLLERQPENARLDGVHRLTWRCRMRTRLIQRTSRGQREPIQAHMLSRTSNRACFPSRGSCADSRRSANGREIGKMILVPL